MKKCIFQMITILLILVLIKNYPVFAISDSQNSSDISMLNENETELEEVPTEPEEDNGHFDEIREIDVEDFFEFDEITSEELGEKNDDPEIIEEIIVDEVEEEPTIFFNPQPTTIEEIPTIFDYAMANEIVSEMSVTVDSAESFLQALENQVDEITLTANITITIAIGPSVLPPSSIYDIVKDLTIYGQGHTLTVNYSGHSLNYFRLTGSGNLKVFDLTIISNSSYRYNLFSLYDPAGNANAIWNAEFTNVKFTGGGLIGQQNLSGANGSIGNVTFYGVTELNVLTETNSTYPLDAVIYAKSVIFEEDVSISANYGYYIQNGFIYAVDDIVINRDITAVTSGQGAYYGLFCSGNGTIYFNGNVNLEILQSIHSYHRPIIKANGVKFFGNQTTINVTHDVTNHNILEYTLIYAAEVELGKPTASDSSNASVISINAKADTAFFKSSANLGSFTVHPYTTVNLKRDAYYGILNSTSTKTMIEGYTNFYFEHYCHFIAEAMTESSHISTAVILSTETFDFIVGNNASVSLTSLQGASTHVSGQSALILTKPDVGCLTFTIENGASLNAVAFGTSTHTLHGLAPIKILGSDGRPDSSSVTTVYGALTTTSNNGNGWYYQYSVGTVSGKDTFIVDGGQVNLIANASLKRTSLIPENSSAGEYAAFEHYTKNELEITIVNGGYMYIKSDGWRAMSLAGGEAGTAMNSGVKTINVVGRGQNNVTGEIIPSTLELNAGQFAIAAESHAALYINVLDGGHFYSNNTQDSNIYTTGSAVYTVSGTGAEFRIYKSGKSLDGTITYSLYGAIFHDAPIRGPLEIYVKDGGTMYVESNYGSRAAICAQAATQFQHIISVTGVGSDLTVINNNTTDASVAHSVIQNNALYPIGAIAFAANTSGNIYVEDGGSFYAESHNPYSPTIALGGYGADAVLFTTSGTVFLNNPGFFDIRNDSDTNGDIRATALRGRAYILALSNLSSVARSFLSNFSENPQVTLNVEHSDITVYQTNGSAGTSSYMDWPAETIIRSWKDTSFTAGNIQTIYNVMNGDGSNATDGLSAGTSIANSFSLHTYGRITVRGGYQVIYDGNGGETSENITQYYAGLYDVNTLYNVMNNDDIGFLKFGAVFVCWNTALDGSGDSYNPDDVLTITGDITLYAIWKNSVDVQFILPHTGGKGIDTFTSIGMILLGVSGLCALLGLRSGKYIIVNKQCTRRKK